MRKTIIERIREERRSRKAAREALESKAGRSASESSQAALIEAFMTRFSTDLMPMVTRAVSQELRGVLGPLWDKLQAEGGGSASEAPSPVSREAIQELVGDFMIDESGAEKTVDTPSDSADNEEGSDGSADTDLEIPFAELKSELERIMSDPSRLETGFDDDDSSDEQDTMMLDHPNAESEQWLASDGVFAGTGTDDASPFPDVADVDDVDELEEFGALDALETLDALDAEAEREAGSAGAEVIDPLDSGALAEPGEDETDDEFGDAVAAAIEDAGDADEVDGDSADDDPDDDADDDGVSNVHSALPTEGAILGETSDDSSSIATMAPVAALADALRRESEAASRLAAGDDTDDEVTFDGETAEVARDDAEDRSSEPLVIADGFAEDVADVDADDADADESTREDALGDVDADADADADAEVDADPGEEAVAEVESDVDAQDEVFDPEERIASVADLQRLDQAQAERHREALDKMEQLEVLLSASLESFVARMESAFEDAINSAIEDGETAEQEIEVEE